MILAGASLDHNVETLFCSHGLSLVLCSPFLFVSPFMNFYYMQLRTANSFYSAFHAGD